ncbi:hypothetical protein HDV04_004070 [Boothiomyces sp. JEL0838]|nr:hypothetical protein HDV04_004070 [Boothiomyces sp. JEL0838]
MNLKSLFAVFTFALGQTNPYLPGQNGENKELWKFGASPAFDENLHIFVPKDNSDTFPLVLFFSGFGSNLPTAAYSEVLSEMASKAHGAVVVAWDGLTESNPLDMPGILARTNKILEFCQTKLQDYINANFANKVVVDPSRLFFAAHSSGNQIAVEMALSNPSLGMILLDPVDSDPVKLTKPVINGTVAYDKPVMVVASGLCEVSGINLGKVFPPCCPPGFSSQHFYDAFTNVPKYMYTVTDYGHADLLSPNAAAWAAHFSHFCASVADPNKNPFDNYRNFISGAVSSFISLYGFDDCGYSKYLTDSSYFDTNVAFGNANLDRCQ